MGVFGALFGGIHGAVIGLGHAVWFAGWFVLGLIGRAIHDDPSQDLAIDQNYNETHSLVLGQEVPRAEYVVEHSTATEPSSAHVDPFEPLPNGETLQASFDTYAQEYVVLPLVRQLNSMLFMLGTGAKGFMQGSFLPSIWPVLILIGFVPMGWISYKGLYLPLKRRARNNRTRYW